MDAEVKRLDRVARWYDARTDFDRHTRKRIAALIELHRRGTRLLEVGCGTGAMTRYLTGRITCIDGSPTCIEQCRSQTWKEDISFQECLAEEYDPGGGQFDDIVMAGLLEHVENPLEMLRRARSWVTAAGHLHVSVPNALSLHRRLGVAMGKLAQVDAMSDRDRDMGHRRIYQPSMLMSQLKESGWQIIHWEGILLKPLSSAQMNDWPDDVIDGLIEAGRLLPEWCAELYFVCQVPGAC